MAKAPAEPPAENERDHRDHLLSRALRVIAQGNGVFEVAPQPGYRITFSDELDGDRRRVRILVGPADKPAKGG
jgi:hypothetical protein